MSQRDKAVDSLCAATQQLIAHYLELMLAIHNKRNELSLASELAVQTTLSLLVQWENFVHDILLAYAMTDPRRLVRSTEERVLQSVEAKFGRTCARHVRLQFPRNLTLKMIALIADEKGRNITAPTANDLAARANNLLSGKYARRFTLEPPDYEFYDYVVATRNYLGHFSAGALKTLRAAIGNMQHPENAVFTARFTHIGPYLRARVDGQVTRTELIGQRLQELANRM